MIRIAIAGAVLWVARMAATVGFLDNNGRLPVTLDDGRLPGNVEYFFTTLMTVYCLGAAVAAWWLLRRVPASRAAGEGVRIALGLLAVFLVADAAMEMFVAHRGWAHHLRNVVLDYGPLVIIPVVAGLIAARGDETA
jgi:hypothetical protein